MPGEEPLGATALEIPAQPLGDVSRHSMEEEQGGVAAVESSNGHPLIDPTDVHLFKPLPPSGVTMRRISAKIWVASARFVGTYHRIRGRATLINMTPSTPKPIAENLRHVCIPSPP